MTRILIVEDEPALSEPLAFLLKREGYEIEVADDGREALAAFDRALKLDLFRDDRVARAHLHWNRAAVLDLLGRPGPTAEIVTLPTAEPEPAAAPTEAEPADETAEAASPEVPAQPKPTSGETLEPAGERT